MFMQKKRLFGQMEPLLIKKVHVVKKGLKTGEDGSVNTFRTFSWYL